MFTRSYLKYSMSANYFYTMLADGTCNGNRNPPGHEGGFSKTI
jgi:hypothetical protein